MATQEAFREVERQFQWYTDEWQGGRLDLAGYRSALNRLRIADAQGRQWMLQERSGQWHVWTGNLWEPGLPYQQAAPPGPPPPPAPPPPAYPTGQSSAILAPSASHVPASDGGGGSLLGGLIKYALITMVLFGLLGVALLLFAPDFGVEGLMGVGLAALISFVLMAGTLNKNWEGEITELYQKRVQVASGYDDAPDDYRNMLYARIRQPSGKMREEQAMPNWQVGNYLRKRRGQAQIEIVR